MLELYSEKGPNVFLGNVTKISILGLELSSHRIALQCRMLPSEKSGHLPINANILQ